MRLLPPLFLLLACSGKDETNDDTGDTGETADTSAAEFSPEVVSVDRVECTEQQSAGELWSFTISIADPQGADTVDGGTVYARDPNGAALAEYAFPCDDSGQCSGSFRAAYDNLPCSMGGTLTLGFVVVDQQDYASAEFSYQTIG
jgi:hypothetical protein